MRLWYYRTLEKSIPQINDIKLPGYYLLVRAKKVCMNCLSPVRRPQTITTEWIWKGLCKPPPSALVRVLRVQCGIQSHFCSFACRSVSKLNIQA